MAIRVALLVLTALGLVGFGIVAFISIQGSDQPPAAAAVVQRDLTVIAAAHPLRAGSLIKPEDLATHTAAAKDTPAGAEQDAPQARSALIGAMIRRSLVENEPLLPADIIRPGDHGFLAAVLGPGMRAVTVAVDNVSGTAGLIWPGDRVDLILTQSLEDPGLAVGRRVAAETVLSGIRVIAIDQQLVQGQAPDGAPGQNGRTATLEVSSADAERVLVATRIGRLSLSVRSSSDRPDHAVAQAAPASPSAPAPPAVSATPAVTWAGDVSPALGASDRKLAPPATVRVYSGGADPHEFKF